MWCHLVTRMHSDEQGVETLCINQLSWTINYVHPPLLCPETNVSWRAQVCFLLPPSAVAHDDVCKSHKHLSYMAREEMRRQTLAKKQALIALFFCGFHCLDFFPDVVDGNHQLGRLIIETKGQVAQLRGAGLHCRDCPVLDDLF